MFVLGLLVWFLLLVVAWPIAIVALLLLPLLWLLSIPFRIFGFAVAGMLAFIRALFFLPARILGYRG